MPQVVTIPQIDGLTAIAVILIAAFAIDRIATGILFGLSYLGPWVRTFPDPLSVADGNERRMAEKKQKLAYFVLAGIFAIVVLAGFGNLRIFTQLGFKMNAFLDVIVTGLIMVGGSDRIAAILKLSGGPGADQPTSRPIEITGKLVLEEGASRAVLGGSEGETNSSASSSTTE